MSPRLQSLRLPAGLALAVLFVGCQVPLPVAPTNSEITSLTQRINQLETGVQKSSTQVEKTQNTIDTTSQQMIANLQQQRQLAANAVYSANQANLQNPQKNAYTETITASLQLAAANLGGADAQGMQNAATELKLHLANTQAAQAQLQSLQQSQLDAASALQKQLGQEQQTRASAQSQLESLQTERNTLQAKAQNLENQRNQAQTTLAQKLQAENERLASDQALRGKLVLYLVLAGVLSGLAAAVAFRVYPPIGLHIALASGGFFLAAYLVTEVQPWMVLLIIGLAVAALVWAVVIRHRRLSGIADSALGALQQLKIRAAHGDAVAQQAWSNVESDLKNHFGAQADALENEAKERLARIPWLPQSSLPVAPAPVPAPAPANLAGSSSVSVPATATPAGNSSAPTASVVATGNSPSATGSVPVVGSSANEVSSTGPSTTG